jgi:hypothetical protein
MTSPALVIEPNGRPFLRSRYTAALSLTAEYGKLFFRFVTPPARSKIVRAFAFAAEFLNMVAFLTAVSVLFLAAPAAAPIL